MDYDFETIDLHCFVESAFLGDIGHNAEVELGGGRLGVRIFDFLGFLFGADSCYDGMPMLEENVEDMRSDETTATCCSVNIQYFGMSIVG